MYTYVYLRHFKSLSEVITLSKKNSLQLNLLYQNVSNFVLAFSKSNFDQIKNLRKKFLPKKKVYQQGNLIYDNNFVLTAILG